MNNLLNILYATNALVFVFLMALLVHLLRSQKYMVEVPKEGFCTCRGMQYNNSSADLRQANCYKNRIPSQIWQQSHAGCTSVDDPGKISYNYNILQKQLPTFAGV
jgi:hypothetical protein